MSGHEVGNGVPEDFSSSKSAWLVWRMVFPEEVSFFVRFSAMFTVRWCLGIYQPTYVSPTRQEVSGPSIESVLLKADNFFANSGDTTSTYLRALLNHDHPRPTRVCKVILITQRLFSGLCVGIMLGPLGR